MINKANNYAFIDGANLHKGVAELGWKLDYFKFRIWLRDKYNIGNAYIFLGLVSKHKDIYASLQEAGFILIFKETTYDGAGKVRGNCDADLVLKTVVDYYEKSFSGAVLISSDGDYAGLVRFLNSKNVFISLVSPSDKCSFLLRKINVPLLYLSTQYNKLKRDS